MHHERNTRQIYFSAIIVKITLVAVLTHSGFDKTAVYFNHEPDNTSEFIGQKISGCIGNLPDFVLLIDRFKKLRHPADDAAQWFIIINKPNPAMTIHHLIVPCRHMAMVNRQMVGNKPLIRYRGMVANVNCVEIVLISSSRLSADSNGMNITQTPPL